MFLVAKRAKHQDYSPVPKTSKTTLLIVLQTRVGVLILNVLSQSKAEIEPSVIQIFTPFISVGQLFWILASPDNGSASSKVSKTK